MKTEKQKQGKKNKAAGARFEMKVRKDLESKGWIVDKWSNNISDYPEENINKPPEEREDRKIIPAKRKYNPFKKVMVIGTGFPDFIAYAFCLDYNVENLSIEFGEVPENKIFQEGNWEILGVEVKSNGYLTKEEKEKCDWLLKNNVFSKILIASKGEKRGTIKYKEVYK